MTGGKVQVQAGSTTIRPERHPVGQG